MRSQPSTIPWLAEPPPKERLTMISRPPCSIWRRRFGYAALMALFVSSAALAQAGNPAPAATDNGPGRDSPFGPLPPPFPPDAPRNHVQGVVMLKVLVGTDGAPRKIDVDNNRSKASPEFAKVASDTAMTWRFNPRIENGKAVEAWSEVPVFFSLGTLPPHPHMPPPPGAFPPPPPGGPMPPPPPGAGWPDQPTSSSS
jgi:TonB family protein